MKKKIKIFLMCFILLCMSVFTGCSLVETDNYRLYNNVVSVIYQDGKKIAEITNRELLSGYEVYGSQLEYSGVSKKEAVEMTMTQLQNRKLLLHAAELKYDVNVEDGGQLSGLEKSYIYEQTVESLNNNLQSYYDDIVNNESEDEEDDTLKFNGYTKNIERKYNGNVPVLVNKEKQDGILDGYRPEVNKSYYNKQDREEIYNNFIEKIKLDENYLRAFDYYKLDLKSAEYGMQLSNNVKEMFEREILRLYKVNYENYLVEKYTEDQQKEFKESITVDGKEISSISVDNLLKLYSSKVRADYTKYQIEQASTYDDDAKDSSKTVYYYKQGEDDTKYFKVANILFQFKDGQDEEYKEIQAKWEDKNTNKTYTEEQYNRDLDDLYGKIEPVVREYDRVDDVYRETDEDKEINDIIKELKTELDNEIATGDVGRIGDTVNEYIYMYNEDPGMLNSQTNYIIGVDKDGNAVSDFVEEFNEAGLELYKRDKIGDFEVARTSYGIHVIIYLGKCENLFDGIDENFELGGNSNYTIDNSNFEKLYNTRVNILVDKSYIDLLYDEIYTDSYENVENAYMNKLRNEFTFKVYSGRYPSTLK